MEQELNLQNQRAQDLREQIEQVKTEKEDAIQAFQQLEVKLEMTEEKLQKVQANAQSKIGQYHLLAQDFKQTLADLT